MQLKKLNLFIQLLLAIVLFPSCSRRGCTDKDGNNYEPNAKVDCSCCYYYGKAFIWYRDPFYTTLQNEGVSNLMFYVDGSFVSKTSNNIIAYETYSGNPAYNEDYLFTTSDPLDDNVLTLNMGSQKTKSYNLVVKDQGGVVRWQGIMTLNANKVVAVELY
jgi:hypothetical protein